ncbi:MAG: arylsulfatase [Sphingomonadales bacterium]|nr:arylsulfatase [Sphingomonadales bacterium]
MPVAAKSSQSAPKPQAARPNILLIVLDDVGFSDFGAFGSEIRTPNIDALARQGLRYNRFDTKSICSPTRAALLTGRNNQTVHMEDLAANVEASADPSISAAARGELPRNAETVAQALHRVGYATFALGKWHLAPRYDDKPGFTKASWPLQRGFDRFYGFLSGWTDQYKPDLVEDNAPIAAPSAPDYHLTPDLIDHAISAFGDKAEEGGKPRFVYLALGAAHAPIQVPRPYIDAYADTYAKGWDAIRAERFARLKQQGVIPANTVLPPREAGDRAWSDLTEQEKTVFARFMATYAGFITHTDAQIGRLIDHLRKTGQYENTLIVLLSDNGGAPEAGQIGGFKHPYRYDMSVADMAQQLDKLGGPESQALYQRPWALAGATPFRRYKLWPYAGGTRTPLVVSWQNGIKAHGEVRGQFVDAIDIGPTLLDVAGTSFRKSIDGTAQIPVAGRSIRATFASPTARTRDIQFFELFDTSADYSESTDLSARYPAKLKELQALWWREARKYSEPALAEPARNIRAMRQFEDGAPSRAQD